MASSLTARACAATVATLALVGSSLTTANAALPTAVCATTTPLTLLNFNDFHGRLANVGTTTTDPPQTTMFAGTIEEQRAAAGEANSLLLSAGDSVGATLFPSFAQNDEPTIDVLNAMDVDASAAGNHEFDQGWPDLRDRIIPGVDFPYLAANIVLKGTNTPAMDAYTVIDKVGLRIGIVGAVTGELPSLVSPDGLSLVDVQDPVVAVNRTIADLKDGNTANGEADVIVVEYHEGATNGGLTMAENMALSQGFADIVTKTDARAQVIFNAHTHQVYTYDGPVTGGGTRPILQAGSYAGKVGKVTLTLDATTGATCDYQQSIVGITTTPVDTLVAMYPRVAAVKTLVDSAVAQAAVIGERVVGEATAPITRAFTFGTRTNPDGSITITRADDRLRESTMSNLVARMFKEVLGPDDPEFIGMQNPGGTRNDFNTGPITYAEAAAILPFANTLMTTQLTGAQVKTVLEQQWQADINGLPLSSGSRPYLRLGLSPNLTYTYDASKPRLSRITSISINGKPIDPTKLYTVGSGSYLIAGGDNFFEFRKGVNKKDTGRADLESFVGWITAQGTVSPSFAMSAVSLPEWPPTLLKGDTTYTVHNIAVPQDAVALDTLDFKSAGVSTTVNTPGPANTTLTAQLYGFSGKGKAKVVDGTVIGSATVVDGKVAALNLLLPGGVPAGTAYLKLVAAPSGTTVYLGKVTLKSASPTKK